MNNKITVKPVEKHLNILQSFYVAIKNAITGAEESTFSRKEFQLLLNDVPYYQNADKQKVTNKRIFLMNKLNKEANESNHR